MTDTNANADTTPAAAATGADTTTQDTTQTAPKTGADNQGGEGSDIDTSDSLLNDDIAAVDFTKGKPADMPDELWDAEANAPKPDALWSKLQEAEQRAKGLRDKLAKGEGKPPKDPKEYSFKPSEKAMGIFAEGDPSKDPLVQAAAPIAHKYGLSKDAFQGFMSEMSDKIADLVQNAADNPPELTPEQKKEIRDAEFKKIGPNAPQVVRAVESWGRELEAQGIFNKSDLAAFKSMAITGEQLRVLNTLRAMAGGGKNIPMDTGSDGLPSDAEIAEMQANVKTQADQDKVDALYEKRRLAGRPDTLQI